MFRRNARWLVAGLFAAAALVAAPTRSRADTQIMVQELDSGGNPVELTPDHKTALFFTGTVATLSTPNFSAIQVTPTPNSGAISSLTTTVSAVPGTDTSHQLRIVVTSDGFTTPTQNIGGTANVDNNAAASSGIGGGQNILSNQTQLLYVPLNPAANQIDLLAAGSPLGTQTTVATDVRPGGGVSPTTSVSIQNMPGPFAIQQTITVKATPTGSGGIDTGSTLGGSASSIVRTSAPVPAPAGVLLGLLAVPVFAARRVLRRTPA